MATHKDRLIRADLVTTNYVNDTSTVNSCGHVRVVYNPNNTVPGLSPRGDTVPGQSSKRSLTSAKCTFFQH